MPPALDAALAARLAEAVEVAREGRPGEAAAAFGALARVLPPGGHWWLLCRLQAARAEGAEALRTLHGELVRAYPAGDAAFLKSCWARARPALAPALQEGLVAEEARAEADAALVEALRGLGDPGGPRLRRVGPAAELVVHEGPDGAGVYTARRVEEEALAGALLADARPAGSPLAYRLAAAAPPDPFRVLASAAPGEALPGLVLYVGAGEGLDPAADAERKARLHALLLVGSLVVLTAGLGLAVASARRSVALAELRAHFVAAVSHDMKTPLALIQMFADTVRMGRSQGEEERGRFLGIVSRECGRLGRRVDDLLAFSGMESGRLSYRPEPVEMAALVEEVLDLHRPSLEESGFTLRTELAREGTRCQADPEALRGVLHNLVANAMKFSGQVRELEVVLGGAGVAGASVRLEVRDRGPGIPAEERERVFERYYRGRAACAGAAGGAGVGLSLVRHAVTAHGGRVWVEGRAGGGTSMVVELPALAVGGP
ncbi:MAG: HAMP domain-containing histidine kinase [Planctomycetes bacterium]|nr:HAMP domain-containing histidine kinase [Planctomycetota bacterium]